MEIQTELIEKDERWTQKPANLNLSHGPDDVYTMQQNLRGCGGGRQVYHARNLFLYMA